MPYHAGRADGDSRTGNSNVITSQAMRILKLLIQLVLWSFSFFATPICMAHLTALLEKRCAQLPEVALPEPIPLSRAQSPFAAAQRW